MKIEKVSATQIRCTLNSSDLHSRSLTLSDLAYGNPKAKKLFAEMMHLADEQFGFHIENQPIMVEAVPLSGGGLMLLISGVDDPDELDTRFAKFAPGMDQPADENRSADQPKNDLTANLLEAFENLLKCGENEEDSHIPEEEPAIRAEAAQDAPKTAAPAEAAAVSEPRFPANVYFVYSFADLDTIISAAHAVKDVYQGKNSLFKSEDDHRYYLVVHRSGHSSADFNKVCNVLTEFGDRVVSTIASESYFTEHLDLLTGPTALQDLAQV